MAWYSEIQQRFDGEVHYSEKDDSDGTHVENVHIVIPGYDIQAIRYDYNNQDILVGVNSWQTWATREELANTIIERMDLHGH